MYMKRSNSLSQIDLGSGRKRSSTTPKKSYRGRLSLKATTVGLRTRRSGRSHRESLYDDAEDELYGAYADETSSPRGAGVFRCLAVIERVSSSSCSAADVRSSGSSSLESPSPTPTTVDCDRTFLSHDFWKFLKDDSNARSSLVMSSQSSTKPDKMFTIGKKRFLFGDVLWLILKTYLAGGEVCGGQDATLDEDCKLFERRQRHEGVLQKILEFRVDGTPTSSNEMHSAFLSKLFRTHLQVVELLEEYDHYHSLFPTSRSMEETVAKAKDRDYINAVLERVALLTAWVNTVDDLAAKMHALGELFQVSLLPDAEKVWPRPLTPVHRSDDSFSLFGARQVFSSYVGRSMNLKGMKKVLERVWEICETTIVKTALLLQKPYASYAQAASATRFKLTVDPELQARFEDTKLKVTFYDKTAVSVNLPSLEPLFMFILGVRVELVREWLKLRSNTPLPSEDEMDLLTLDAMIVDSKDCFESAVEVKRHYDHTMHVLSIFGTSGKCQASVFNDLLNDVFQKYLWYVNCWSDLMAKSNLSHPQLFGRIEEEWKVALANARHIRCGLDHLTNTLSCLGATMLEELIEQYWADRSEEIISKQSSNDIHASDDEDGVDDTSSVGIANVGTTVFTVCREYNWMLRDLKERSKRIFGLLKYAFADLSDVASYETSYPLETIVARLSDHCLVEVQNSDSLEVSILVDAASANSASVLQLVEALCEGRSLSRSSDNGPAPHLILLPFKFESVSNLWRYRRQPITICEETLQNLTYRRTDFVCVSGDFQLHRRYPDLFELVMLACPSNTIVSDHLGYLASKIVDHAETMWQNLQEMSDRLNAACIVPKKAKSHVHNILLLAYNYIFDLYRDVCRLVFKASLHIHGDVLVRGCVRAIHGWRLLVEQYNPPKTPYIPLWAQFACNFISNAIDYRWTKRLNDDEFQLLKEDMDSIRRFLSVPDATLTVESSINGRHNVQKPKSRGDRRPASESAGSENQSRRDRFEAAIKKVDDKIAAKNCFPLGHVVDKPREQFKLENYVDRSKGAPFEWQMLEKIGQGAFAKVYKGLNLTAKCVIAVKRIRTTRKDSLKILQNEVDILRTLNHPNLVKYHGCEVQNDEIVMLMEYCAEGTLERVCREGLEMTLVRRYVNSLLQAVAYIHSRQVIHRDIKPANIFLDLQCVLKLGDFGCSVRLDSTSTVFGELRQYIGTPQYMAPEIQTGGEMCGENYRGYGRAVDIWSVGCVVLEMVTGRRPWPKDMDQFQIVMKVGSGARPTYPHGASAILHAFLDGCFEFNPDKRKTATQLLQHPFANVHVDADETTYTDQKFPLSTPPTPPQTVSHGDMHLLMK